MKRWVINISKCALSKDEQSLLAKGLNYAVTPSEVPKDDLIVATEVACRGLPQASACQLRAEVAGVLKTAKVPTSNITKDERKAMQMLKMDKQVIYLPQIRAKPLWSWEWMTIKNESQACLVILIHTRS